MADVGVLGAFVAGLISFLSPCVLPLIPVYLSFITGASVKELLEEGKVSRGTVLARSLLFVAGFSVVFVSLGATATALGGFLQQRSFLLNRAAGLLVIFFGLQLLGVFRLRFLMTERRYQGGLGGGFLKPVLLGMAFAFGWSPCVGPVLFSIMAYASTQETLARGVLLLAVYSAGLGLPFLLVGVGVGRFIALLDRFKPYLRWVEIGSGVFLVVFGLLMVAGRMSWLTALIPPGWLPGE